MKEGPPNSHELRKRDLLAGIDRRVAAVKTFKHAMDSVTGGEPVDEVRANLQEGVERAFHLFPQETRNEAEEFTTVFKQKVFMEAEMDISDLDPCALRKFNRRLSTLGKNPDVILLHSLTQASAIQGDKYRVVSGIASDDASFQPFVDENLTYRGYTPLDWSEVGGVVNGPFSVSIVGNQRYFESYRPNSRGFHVRNSPIIIIKDLGEEEVRKTIRHENIHNAFDGLEMNIGGAKKALDRVGDFKEDSPDLDSAKYASRLRSVNQVLTVSEVVNGSHEEFLAHLQNMQIELSEFRDYIVPNDYSRNLSNGERVRGLNKYLSSAGGEMNKLIDELTKTISEKPKSWLGKTSEQFLSEVYIKWLQVVRAMYNGRRHAQINKSMEEDILLFFVVTNPMNFHHIDSYVAYKRDGEKLEQDTGTPHLTASF